METINILSKLNSLKEERQKVAGEAKELLERFDTVLEYREKERLRLEDEISKLTSNRNEAEEKLKALTKNILIYEINLNEVRQRLGELENKGASVKKYYEEILTGPVSNIFTFKEGLGIGESGAKDNPADMNIQTNPDECVSDTKKTELLGKKKELMEAMDSIFSKYESEVKEIEDEKNRLKAVEDDILKKDEKAKKQREILTNSLEAYSEEIKGCRENLASSIHEEMTIIEEFSRIIKNIDRAVIVSDEVKDILNKVSAAV
ncbi:MAG: hypothetical protein HY279_02395 [Nitrospinae bacterium]|nr:hypothetical protein [Nitrospinota bacterium]